ncbi:hypothetical protein AGABI2DRAFT_178715 [Agaricus bisporus var. bisporus H97]|uniref:hypothetical protein n=1 Tax=Agaricus bisporus var. bisporus (strain H97 / ATCC MYA-4626 / FGSC 10389) TaxID=936046 RepID=UPI00029F74C9|nr:hypothetical protein AGABI2DRAFT_178715 [Agaricus bisporus var. bisporus H97]EKV46324.1 hypothetical protein AGABI2DRAFT_178715 [Agaricus bisporus var. bisporus H97]
MPPLAPRNRKPTAEDVELSAREQSATFYDAAARPSLKSAELLPPTHAVDIPQTVSPPPMSGHISDSRLSLDGYPVTTRWKILLHLISKTAPWVMGGIFFMLFGIGLTQAVIFPKIYACPSSGTCDGSYDPNDNALQLLQSFITYWLQAGLMLASVGLLRLNAYQAWFILMQEGNTVKDLDLNLGAIRGSVADAFFLLFRKNNRLLSLFVLALLGVNTAISLILGFSIVKQSGTKVVDITYNATSMFPNSDLDHLNSKVQLKAAQKAIVWALDNDTSHEGALRGSLVVPGDRSTQATNALPAGPKISGRFECEGFSNYTFDPDSSPHQWYINVADREFIANANMTLHVAMRFVNTAVTRYLWVSNTTGLIPNATTTEDGGLHIAYCAHWVEMEPEEPKKDGYDYLNANTAFTSGCDDGVGSDTCIADSVNNAILNWWGGEGAAFWHISCRGGILGPIPPSNDAEEYCPLTQELWKETTIAMLDGIMQTAQTSISSSQRLQTVVEDLDRQKWWLNAIIPAATFVLYLVGLAYTSHRSQGDLAFKKLSLDEVVRAAQTDHIHDLILTGQLTKTPVRYYSQVGFVDRRNQSSTY